MSKIEEDIRLLEEELIRMSVQLDALSKSNTTSDGNDADTQYVEITVCDLSDDKISELESYGIVLPDDYVLAKIPIPAEDAF